MGMPFKMTYTLSPAKQGTDEWKRDRIGRITGTISKSATSKTKSVQDTLIVNMIEEIATGIPKGSYSSDDMDDGTELEPVVRELYEQKNECVIYGHDDFIYHEKNRRFADSPDGITDIDGTDKRGGIEIKCPQIKQFARCILDPKTAHKKYLPQCDWHMFVGGLEWIDLVIYCASDAIPEESRYQQTRYFRDEKRMTELEQGGRAFLKRLDEAVEKLGIGF
jgi:hypothetical protein